MKYKNLKPRSVFNRFLQPIGLMLLLWGFAGLSEALATHNLAGQIVAERLSGNRYKITLTTYTDPAPAGVDRCKADIEIWTTNGQQITIINDVGRSNGPLDQGANPLECPPGVRRGVEVYTTVKRNIYDTTFTFPGPGCYILRYYDLARREDVINIKDPGNQTFFVETQLCIPNPLLGINNTPVLLNEPLDEACVGKIYTHNPGGFDPDGDSLVYSLLPSLQYEPPKGINAPTATTGYRFPDDSQFGNSSFTIDSRTGLITWDVPMQVGVYNVAYRVEEYRRGILQGYVIRDMVIFVKPCDNNPPVIETISDTCVTANDTLNFDYLAYDPDFLDSVYLELNNSSQGVNGPFNPALPNPATLRGVVVDPDSFFNPWPYNSLPVGTLNGLETNDTIKGTVTWLTECGNIRSTFYQVDFYAHDNFGYYGNPAMLSAHKVVTIQVIPPKPTGLEAVKSPGEIALNWEPNACPNVVGYNVYRKVGGSGLAQDTVCCDVSPSQMGYDLISYNQGGNNVSLVDSLEGVTNFLGDEICYVVTALFEDDDDGFEPNMESCGIEACIKIENDDLYLTNDSIAVTDPANGEIFVSWSKPDSIDSFFEGPFYYRLYRANNNQYPILMVADQLNFDTDTTFMDMGLDTESRGYNYRVEVIDKDGKIIFTSEDSNIGSSIYLTTQGGNNIIDLEWTEYVPWTNSDYEVHRSDNGGPFVPIAVVPGTGASVHRYTDTGLDKEIEYCYLIRSTGSFFLPGVKDPTINDSQIACDFARDDEPPCNPEVLAFGNCDDQVHTVRITKPTDPCADDIKTITVYFANRVEGPYEPVQILDYDSLGGITELTYPISDGNQTFAGCYAVTATDAFNNTSTLSEPFCIDFCPILEMGNVFTPNDDGINDIFVPVRHQDVRLVRFSVFDRWGREVHRTDNEISSLWGGIVSFTNQQASEGTYYYYIVYDELGLNGNVRKEQKGWVVLMR